MLVILSDHVGCVVCVVKIRKVVCYKFACEPELLMYEDKSFSDALVASYPTR
jgi:hypothetical protein